MKVFLLVPAVVWLPVTSKVAPSRPMKPSPAMRTSPHVTGVPSYTLLALPLVSVTARLSICQVVERSPVKLPFAFTVSVYVPACVAFSPASV